MIGPLLFLVAALAAPSTEARRTVLPNGLVVIVEPQDRTDEVALFLKVRVGSRDERDGEHGCAHLFEHLMFEGSRNVPENAFDTWLTAAGGGNNAWTSEDETVYHMTFPSGALDLALFLESDRLAFLDAAISDRTLANQQDVVLQERDRGYAGPHGRDLDSLTRLLFPPRHPYHVPVIGTVADIRGFQTTAVLEFWRRHYRPANATLVLVGRVDPDEAVARVAHWFGDVPDTGPAPARPSLSEPAATPAAGVVEDDVEDRTLHVAWRSAPATHADAPALEVLAGILSDGRGTRLDDALYFDRPLATGSWAWSWSSDLSGMFAVGATSPTTPLPKLLTHIDRVLDHLQVHAPSEAELARAQQRAVDGLRANLELPEDRAALLLSCQERWGDPNCVDAQITRLQAVTAADVQRVARTWLHEAPRVTLSVVPRGSTKGALAGARPVELP